jgi:predicted phosphodiesterase
MTKPRVSDQEFAQLFNHHGSPQRVADALGISVRAVYNRRRKVEDRYGIDLLSCANNHSEAGKRLAQSIKTSIPKKLSFDCPDGTIVIGSDAHYWPGEASVAHQAFVKVIKELKPKAVILNGDVVDGARVSRHDPLYGTTPPSIKQEIEVCQERLGEIEKAFKNAALIWTYGNHDTRLWRYLRMHAPEVEGMHGMDIFDYFPGWRHGYLVEINNDTIVKHRWHNGVHATYNNTLKGGRSIVTGHLHRLQISAWGDYNGRRYGVDTGCLAEPDHEAFAYTEGSPVPWASGFAVLTYKDSRLLPPELCEVRDGVAYFRGQAI